MSAFVKKLEEVPLETVAAGTGTSRSVLISPEEAPHFAMRRFVMERGGGMPNHKNTVEHEQIVMRGAARVGIGDDVFEVKQGDVVYIPEGVPHWYQNDGEEPFEFICLVPNKPDEITLVE